MNWLALVMAAIAALAVVTALVFLYLHRDGSGPEEPKAIAPMNGRFPRRPERRHLDRAKRTLLHCGVVAIRRAIPESLGGYDSRKDFEK